MNTSSQDSQGGDRLGGLEGGEEGRDESAVDDLCELDGHGVERLQVDAGAVEGEHKVDEAGDQVRVLGTAGVQLSAQRRHVLCQLPPHLVNR